MPVLLLIIPDYSQRPQSIWVQLFSQLIPKHTSSSESQAALTRLRQADDERFKLIDQLRDSKDETKSVQGIIELSDRLFNADVLRSRVGNDQTQLRGAIEHNDRGTGPAIKPEWSEQLVECYGRRG